jgi:hypothetical protein
MAEGLEDKLTRLEGDRRAGIEGRAAALMAEGMARREPRPTEVAPRGARRRRV